jgi:hypothetical protein
MCFSQTELRKLLRTFRRTLRYELEDAAAQMTGYGYHEARATGRQEIGTF